MKLEKLHKCSVLVDYNITPQFKSRQFLIDQHLTWNDHIEHISLKIAKMLESYSDWSIYWPLIAYLLYITL